MLLVHAAALCLGAAPAMSAVVDGPATNISVPANIDGVYINLVTGATGTAGGAVAGWDIDPYQGGGVLRFFWPDAPADSSGAASSTASGPYLVLAPGATVSATSVFSAVTAAGTAGTAFIAEGDNYIGFRFFNEATSAINYGYARIQTGASGGFPATIVCWRYENTGAPITVAACGPPVATAPTLTYSPTTAAGVTFPGGAAGAASATIDITAAGAAVTGQSAVTGCAISGPGAASFGAVTTTPANGIFNTATTSGSINLSCTRAAAAATATLSCTETATPTVAGSPFTRSWALTCPAAVATVSSGTVSGTAVTLPRINLPASTSAASLSFTATGGAAAVTCTATGAGFSVSPSPLNLTAGVAGTVTVSYSGSTAGTFTGSLSCTTTGAGGPFTYPLSVTVGQPFAAITVPTMSTLGTLLLVLSVLGFGMFFGARVRD